MNKDETVSNTWRKMKEKFENDEVIDELDQIETEERQWTTNHIAACCVLIIGLIGALVRAQLIRVSFLISNTVVGPNNEPLNNELCSLFPLFPKISK